MDVWRVVEVFPGLYRVKKHKVLWADPGRYHIRKYSYVGIWKSVKLAGILLGFLAFPCPKYMRMDILDTWTHLLLKEIEILALVLAYGFPSLLWFPFQVPSLCSACLADNGEGHMWDSAHSLERMAWSIPGLRVGPHVMCALPPPA